MSDKADSTGGAAHDTPHDQQVEEYGGDRLQARHGRVNTWLCIVYLIMFVWRSITPSLLGRAWAWA